ncbi:MAG: GNAT family N-acetyltransferase [Sulfitobacter sp.]|nr:GNAT family N-acetyltransferase [Sulfitobacter sp.]
MHRLTLAGLCETARTSEVWSLGTPLSACMILSPIAEVLYIGKLAVAPEARRTGLADRLIAFAEARAHARALATLEAQSRVQMTEVHDLLKKEGFREVARTAHPGFTRPTSITFRKDLA